MKSQKTILNISIYSFFIALIVVFSYVPNLGYITLGTISFTTIHIIVLVAAIIFGWKKSTIIGFVFGVFSLLVSIQYPGTVNYLFLNPFVSVLPRILFGLISGLTFDWLRKRVSKKSFLTISGVFAGILSLLHTFLTLTCLYIFGVLDIFKISQFLGVKEIIESLPLDNFMAFLMLFIAPGTICETVASILIVPSVGTLYAFDKLPTNFYNLEIVRKIDDEGNKFNKKQIIITLVISISILVILFTLLIVALIVG